MKATNHPSDKMTIKNNNGDLLLEIDAEGVQEIKFKDGSKYTGAEIDAAVAAGSQVPEIDIEDAGKILGVDAEGKIVAKTDPVPEVDAEDNGKIMKVSDGKWAIGEDAIGAIVSASTLTGDFIRQLQVATGNNVNNYPLTYLAPATFIQAFHTDGTSYSRGNVGEVVQNDYPGDVSHSLEIHNPIIFGVSSTEAAELMTGTTTRVVTVDESEDDATVYIDTNSVLRFIIDTFSFDCSLVAQSGTIYFHGSTILVAGESLYFQSGGTYVVHGTIIKTANDKLTIEIHLDPIV